MSQKLSPPQNQHHNHNSGNGNNNNMIPQPNGIQHGNSNQHKRQTYSGEFLRKRTDALINNTELREDGEGMMTVCTTTYNLSVNRKTFNWLLDAWAFSNENDAPIRVGYNTLRYITYICCSVRYVMLL